MGSNERLRTVLIIAAAVMLAALFLWSLTRDVDAGSVCDSPCGDFCEGLNRTEPEGAPWRLERMRLLENPARVCWCECCDVTGDRAFYDIFPVAAVAPPARPTATAILPPFVTTSVVTAMPAATFTRVHTPIATATLAPTETGSTDSNGGCCQYGNSDAKRGAPFGNCSTDGQAHND